MVYDRGKRTFAKIRKSVKPLLCYDKILYFRGNN